MPTGSGSCWSGNRRAAPTRWWWCPPMPSRWIWNCRWWLWRHRWKERPWRWLPTTASWVFSWPRRCWKTGPKARWCCWIPAAPAPACPRGRLPRWRPWRQLACRPSSKPWRWTPPARASGRWPRSRWPGSWPLSRLPPSWPWEKRKSWVCPIRCMAWGCPAGWHRAWSGKPSRRQRCGATMPRDTWPSREQSRLPGDRRLKRRLCPFR